MNVKQQELINDFYQSTKKQFPEIELINISKSPENPEEVWINVTSPNEQIEEDLILFSADKSTDILLNYGYQILVMPS
jgi:hypothetical protein